MSSIKCLLGIHKFEILEIIDVKNQELTLNKIIVNRCGCCGKIKHYSITLINNYV